MSKEEDFLKGNPGRMRLRSRPWEIAAIYALFGLLWIFFSDKVLALLVPDPDRLVSWSSYKGFAFVLITAVILVFLLKHVFNIISEVYASLEKTEHALRNEKRFNDTMIESMPGILYFYDMQGRFLRWNKNFEKVSGYSSAEIAAMHPLDFFSAQDKGRVEKRIQEVFARGESSVDAEFLSKSGKLTPYFFTGRSVFFEEKNCLVGVGIDISERKQAQDKLAESELKYRELVEHANSIIMRWNADGQITFINHYGRRFFGYAENEIIGRHVAMLVPPAGDDGKALQKLMSDIFSEPEKFEQIIYENQRRSGERVWIDWSNRIVVDAEGRLSEVLSIGRDITDRKKVEEERQMRRQAEEADRIKSAFLATMSHELRTPLNSIIGFTGIMLQGMTGALNTEQNKQLEMVRTSARHLLALVNDVLDISKIEAGQFQIAAEPFDLQGSIVKVLETFRPQAEAKGLELRAELSPALKTAVGDERRFEQIILNLLSNAIKFTEQGRITLAAQVLDDVKFPGSDENRKAVTVKVSDTGIGIKPEDVLNLFQPFLQIDSGLSRKYEGTGLGLAICRRLAELMGGEIHVESEWGKGSTFSVILPLEEPVQQ